MAGGRSIHQIPVIDVLRVAEVEVVDGLPVCVVALADAQHEDQQGEQAFLVDRGVQKDFDLRQWQGSALTGQLADGRDTDADEGVALTVLPRPGLEESSRRRRHLGRGEGVQLGTGFTCLHDSGSVDHFFSTVTALSATIPVGPCTSTTFALGLAEVAVLL